MINFRLAVSWQKKKTTADVAVIIAGMFDQTKLKTSSAASTSVTDRLSTNDALISDGVGKVSATNISNMASVIYRVLIQILKHK